jgi:surface protein
MSNSLFISTWKSDNVSSSGSSGPCQIRLPLEHKGTYDFKVEWGDGFSSDVKCRDDGFHTYSGPGTFILRISGTIRGFCFNYGGDRLKILSISQFGCLNVGKSGGYFAGCSNLSLTATDSMDLTGTTDLSFMFCECIKLNYNFYGFDTSEVTNMSSMFSGATAFNGDIGCWDVSKVTNMNGMFSQAISFNQDLSSWDTTNVTNMHSMFNGASAFAGDIGAWNISKVQNLSFMFCEARAFNADIGGWNISSVLHLRSMFANAIKFNQDLSSWDVSSVVDSRMMFDSASLFDANYSPLFPTSADQKGSLKNNPDRQSKNAAAYSSALTRSLEFARRRLQAKNTANIVRQLPIPSSVPEHVESLVRFYTESASERDQTYIESLLQNLKVANQNLIDEQAAHHLTRVQLGQMQAKLAAKIKFDGSALVLCDHDDSKNLTSEVQQLRDDGCMVLLRPSLETVIKALKSNKFRAVFIACQSDDKGHFYLQGDSKVAVSLMNFMPLCVEKGIAICISGVGNNIVEVICEEINGPPWLRQAKLTQAKGASSKIWAYSTFKEGTDISSLHFYNFLNGISISPEFGVIREFDVVSVQSGSN